eukprot:6500516-Prymnesium_polylepis.1
MLRASAAGPRFDDWEDFQFQHLETSDFEEYIRARGVRRGPRGAHGGCKPQHRPPHPPLHRTTV